MIRLLFQKMRCNPDKPGLHRVLFRAFRFSSYGTSILDACAYSRLCRWGFSLSGRWSTRSISWLQYRFCSAIWTAIGMNLYCKLLLWSFFDDFSFGIYQFLMISVSGVRTDTLKYTFFESLFSVRINPYKHCSDMLQEVL